MAARRHSRHGMVYILCKPGHPSRCCSIFRIVDKGNNLARRHTVSDSRSRSSGTSRGYLMKNMITVLVVSLGIVTPCLSASDGFSTDKPSPLKPAKPGKDDDRVVHFTGSVQLSVSFLSGGRLSTTNPIICEPSSFLTRSRRRCCLTLRKPVRSKNYCFPMPSRLFRCCWIQKPHNGFSPRNCSLPEVRQP